MLVNGVWALFRHPISPILNADAGVIRSASSVIPNKPAAPKRIRAFGKGHAQTRG
jgi:hypothetical protein